ncbi:MAG: type II secretion system F family protein [Firmicutes bacterium]|nr:type II secretion system F family protein [Bacillota bacterium]
MPLYSYQAYDQGGVLISGRLEAENEFVAAAHLREQGYTPLEISPKMSLTLLLAHWKKVSLGELALFSRQLATMLDSGIPLRRSLHVLVQQAENRTWKRCLQEIAFLVESGISISQALEQFPHIFPPNYIKQIKAGEVVGMLEVILQQLSQQLEKEKNLRDNIRSAMFYPLTVLLFALFILIVMLIYAVPVFWAYYPPDTKLPPLTSAIIALSNSLRRYRYYYTAAAAFLGWAVYRLKNSTIGKKAREYISLRLPIWGGVAKKTIFARFTRVLAMLLAGGVPVLQALEVAGPAAGSLLIEEITHQAYERIKAGDSIAAPFRESGFFPPLVTQMMAVGEESGDLPKLLICIAEFYEAEVAALVKGMTSLIEPLMIIGIGSIVGLMVIALYLPMFSVITQF